MKLGEALPALIPQVYLHYDPAVVKLLRHRAGLPRQRMDFLLLLPNNQRVVLEVDGSQHFSRDEKRSLAAYAEMAAADRELRLAPRYAEIVGVDLTGLERAVASITADQVAVELSAVESERHQ